MAQPRRWRLGLLATAIACVIAPAAGSDEPSHPWRALDDTTAVAIPDTTADTTATAMNDSTARAVLGVADTAVQPVPPRRSGGGVGGAITHFGSDLLYIASSPARMNRKDAVVLVAVLGTAAALYAKDGVLYRNLIERHRGGSAYEAVMGAGRGTRSLGLMGLTIPVYAAGAATGRVFGFGSLERVSLELIETHLISGTLRNSIKYLIGRDRPEDMNGPYFFHLGGRSFPSGHASTVFELATIVSEHAGSWPVAASAYALATVVAVERLDAGAHWPSDVFLGSVTGIFVARAIVRRHDEQNAATEWGVSVREGTPTVELTWRF